MGVLQRGNSDVGAGGSMWSRVRSLALTGNLKVQYDHAGRRIKKEEPKSLAADGEAAEPTIGRRVQTTVKRIGGKGITMTQVAASVANARASSNASTGANSKSKWGKAKTATAEIGHFARVGDVVAGAALAFNDALEVSKTKSRVSRNTFFP